MKNSKVLLINGPNLNLLGTREPDIYGNTSLNQIEINLDNYFKKINKTLSCFQSNHEGKIIDFIQNNKDASHIIINPAGLTHTSVALMDALVAVNIPFVEVHITNIYAREDFRKHSYFSPFASGIIAGCGIHGYQLAANLINELTSK